MLTTIFSILLGVFALIIIIYQGSLPLFTIPFFLHISASIYLSIKHLMSPNKGLLHIKTIVFGALPVTTIIPAILFYGGDDGPGMLWVFIIGGASLLFVVLYFCSSICGKLLNRDTANIRNRE
ncbi:hypothetical protein SAMN02745119_03383 [Trichlorobacter thiogenes]|uniref:Uncharacterized protein n=1 Tax=Trichlorobacter thiogenes TaxID=115783 RepID=A0A1T4SB89_9BACT|nr:hypothetical protein SAMN02745119_03383 [Trichlorobacter thiogenes]